MKYDDASGTHIVQSKLPYVNVNGIQYGNLHSLSGCDQNSDRLVGARPLANPIEGRQWKIHHMMTDPQKGDAYRLINNHEQRVLSHRGL